MEVSGLLDGGGAIVELLVAEHCRCPDVQGYLQEALEELQRVLAERQLVSQQPVGEEQQTDGFQVAVSAVDSVPVASTAVCESVDTPSAAGNRQQALADSRQQALAGSRWQVAGSSGHRRADIGEQVAGISR